jgi:hypothetical protein
LTKHIFSGTEFIIINFTSYLVFYTILIFKQNIKLEDGILFSILVSLNVLLVFDKWVMIVENNPRFGVLDFSTVDACILKFVLTFHF